MATRKAKKEADEQSKTPVINQNVSIEGGVFAPGDEEELQGAIDEGTLTHEDVTRLTRLGAISGFTSEPQKGEKDDDALPQADVKDATVRASMAGRARRARMAEEARIDEEGRGERSAPAPAPAPETEA
jgi:hypothetical protein